MQVVTDDMWAGRSERFPEETPSTKEYYLLRSIFEEHFPSQSALDTVPKVCNLLCNIFRSKDLRVLPPYWGHLAGITCRLHGMHRCKEFIPSNALARDLFSVHVSAVCVSRHAE